MTKRILLVDDEAPIRTLLTRYLTVQGFAVASAGSASDAFAAVEREVPDLIISDLQLGDADGLEMIATLRERLPATPVILLTGALFDAEVVREALRGKVGCYLPKTASLATILETIRRLLSETR